MSSPYVISVAVEELINLRRNAARYLSLRNADNEYPACFIAQRSPHNIVVQLTGAVADAQIDATIKMKAGGG